MIMIGVTCGLHQWPNIDLHLIIMHIHDVSDCTNFLKPKIIAGSTNIFHSDKDTFFRDNLS